MSKQTGRIVREVHDEPHLEGRRITVRTVRAQVEELDKRPETVAEQFDLDLAEVYRALAYYHEHPDEMAAVERRREEVAAANRERATTGPEDE